MKYTIISKLGSGSYSSVFLVKFKNEYCALKRLNRNEYESFKNEISFLMKLNHPNIVPIIDYFETSIYYNIFLPYAKYGTLYNLIEKRKYKLQNFDFDDIKTITIEVSKGINYLHENKVIHCDIKPSNILLFGNKIIKICDLGVSKNFKTNKHKTFVGTPYYIAPEIVNDRGYNNSIDYWSLGVIVYELITFRLPFVSRNYYQLITKIIRNKYNTSIIPTKYKTLIYYLLNSNPGSRYKHENIVSFFSNSITLPSINKRR